MNSQYEVLSPWAEAAPVLLRGISPRLKDLDGKKIGLFRNFKPMARPISSVLETKLKGEFPSCEIIRYDSTAPNVLESETENKAKFEEWASGVDAAILLVGD
jgi:hypothetical protein